MDELSDFKGDRRPSWNVLPTTRRRHGSPHRWACRDPQVSVHVSDLAIRLTCVSLTPFYPEHYEAASTRIRDRIWYRNRMSTLWGARRVAVEARLRAQRIGNATRSHTRVRVYVRNSRRNRSSLSKNGAGRPGRCSLRVPETMDADVVSVPDRNRIRYAVITWVSYGPRSTAVVSLTASREGCPRVRRWWMHATEFARGTVASIIVYVFRSPQPVHQRTAISICTWSLTRVREQ